MFPWKIWKLISIKSLGKWALRKRSVSIRFIAEGSIGTFRRLESEKWLKHPREGVACIQAVATEAESFAELLAALSIELAYRYQPPDNSRSRVGTGSIQLLLRYQRANPMDGMGCGGGQRVAQAFSPLLQLVGCGNSIEISRSYATTLRFNSWNHFLGNRFMKPSWFQEIPTYIGNKNLSLVFGNKKLKLYEINGSIHWYATLRIKRGCAAMGMELTRPLSSGQTSARVPGYP